LWFANLYSDGEQALTPDESSLVFGAAVSNFTFLQFSDENNFVLDQRGHNVWIKGEASIFLEPNDPRLLLNTIVTNISYSDQGVIITNDDGSCIEADYAICTFSVGVLQHEDVSFEPELPKWKSTAIEMFQMGTYTKIFLQFDYNFWGNETQFFLYADPVQRGWYPLWQSLDTEGFFPGSNILFVTVVGRESYRVEKMSDEATQEEVMKVLRSMFPDVEVPDPIAFSYPRWTTTPWSYGSYSNWPPSTTLEMHQNLRANVDRLWFAGEHTSSSYFGYMQGAWFEGRDIGGRIAGLVGGVCVNEGEGACGEMIHYETLHGTTDASKYNIKNGWDTTSFQTNGLED
jgi:polyamine oxidase